MATTRSTCATCTTSTTTSTDCTTCTWSKKSLREQLRVLLDERAKLRVCLCELLRNDLEKLWILSHLLPQRSHSGIVEYGIEWIPTHSAEITPTFIVIILWWDFWWW
jgi:hypothetical protein